MTLTKEPKVTKPRNVGKSPVQGVAAVVETLMALVLMPLHMLAEGRNQSIRSLVQEITGLSKARIANGSIDTVRPSTQKKIHKHQQRWLEMHLTDSEALASVRNQIATAPQTQSGKYAALASWIHQLEILPTIPLRISRTVGLTIDELLEALLAACHNDDLEEFKQILLRHIEYHGVAVRVNEEPSVELATVQDLTELRALANWEQTARFTKGFLETLYLDLISTLDAEWNSHYFSGRQCTPLFPLAMVRPQNDLLEGRVPTSRKNMFFRPSRRLLEFLFALVFYIRYKKWPSKPPSPKTLADILYRSGEQEVLANSVVSSYFDGSAKLTLDLVYDYWNQMFHHFMPERQEGQRVLPPFPMIMLALQWQTLLVRDRGKTFLLLDMEKYNLIWHHRRRQWEVHHAKLDKHSPQASHKMGDLIEWPAWMLNQSPSSS